MSETDSDREEKLWRQRHCDVKVLWDFENINFSNSLLPTDEGQAGEYLSNLEEWILNHVGGEGQQVELDKKLFCHGRNQLSLLKNVAAHFAAHGWAQVTTGDGKEEADDLMKDTIDYTLWECSRRDMGELRYCRSIVLITGDRDFAREIRNIKRYMIGAEKTGKHGRPILIYSDLAFDGFVSIVPKADRARFNDICDPQGLYSRRAVAPQRLLSDPPGLLPPPGDSGLSREFLQTGPATPNPAPPRRAAGPVERPQKGHVYQGTIHDVTRPGERHKGMLDVVMLPSMRRGRVFGNAHSDGFPEGKTSEDFRKGMNIIVYVDSMQAPRPTEERYDLIILEGPVVGDVYQGTVKGNPLVDRMRVSILPIPGWEGMVYRNPPHSGFPDDTSPSDFRDKQPVRSINDKGCILSVTEGPTECQRSVLNAASAAANAAAGTPSGASAESQPPAPAPYQTHGGPPPYLSQQKPQGPPPYPPGVAPAPPRWGPRPSEQQPHSAPPRVDRSWRKPEPPPSDASRGWGGRPETAAEDRGYYQHRSA